MLIYISIVFSLQYASLLFLYAPFPSYSHCVSLSQYSCSIPSPMSYSVLVEVSVLWAWVPSQTLR